MNTLPLRRATRLRAPGPVALCAAFALLVLMHNAATPPFEAPDEIWHYAYVRWVSEGHGLPALDSDESGAYQQAAQPPLYYLAAALLSRPFGDDDLDALMKHNPGFGYQAPGTSVDNKNMLIHSPEQGWPWRGAALAVHATRLTSLIFGLVTVLSAYGLAVQATGSQGWAVTTAALVAFHPQFVFISSVISNDSAAAALGGAALWVAARLLRRGVGLDGAVLAGCIAGAAILSKTSALLVAPALGIIVAASGTASPKASGPARRGTRLGAVGVYAATALALGGWWYIRNALRYGTPFGLAHHTGTPWGRTHPASLFELLAELPIVARSFWAAYGWGHITWSCTVYLFLWAVSLPLLLLGVHHVVRAWATAWSQPERRWKLLRPGCHDNAVPIVGLCCLLWLSAIFIALMRWMQQVEAPHGRLLFTALGAWALLTTLGLREITSLRARVGRRWRRTLLGLCAGLATLAPGVRLTATFAQPKLLTVEHVTAHCDSPVDMRFSDQAQLVCVDRWPDRVAAGEKVSVRACWKALAPMNTDYTVFVHLIGPESSRVGERHTYPGLGRYPTSAWTVAEVFCDTYVITTEDWAPTPTHYRIELGLYDAKTGERLPALTAGDQPLDPPVVGAVTLLPRELTHETPAYQAAVTFGDGIGLVGYDRPDRAAPGGSARITLHWEATAPQERDYVAFVHLWRPGDPAPLSQHDSQPRGGWYPTSVWARGDRVPDEHTLWIPETLAPGFYPLWIGLYSPEDGVRLVAEGEAGRLPDDLVPLGQLEIVD